MEEHRSQQREIDVLVGEHRVLGARLTDAVDDLLDAERRSGRHLAGYGRPLVDESLLVIGRPPSLDEEEDQEVGRDDQQRDDRGDPGRVDIAEREHCA